jgi:hypothetical protein
VPTVQTDSSPPPNLNSFSLSIEIVDTMRLITLSLAILASAATTVLAEDEVKIEVTTAVECVRKTVKGDKIDVHYKGMLQSDGSVFDESYKRGQPLSFVVGKGSVIKGYGSQELHSHDVMLTILQMG